MTARPWRAVAFLSSDGQPVGKPLRRAAAKSAQGLQRFCDRAVADGLGFARWEVLPVPEVEALITQAAHSSTG